MAALPPDPFRDRGCRRGAARTASRALVGVAALGLTAIAGAQVTVEWLAPTRGVSIAVDAADNVFTADFEQLLGSEIEVTKRDASGNLLWTSRIDQTDGTKWEAATWIEADSQGNAIVSGTLMSGFSNPVRAASLLLKFAPDGSPLWRIVYESAFDSSYTRKCLVDVNDDIYVLGMGTGPSGFVTKVKKFSSAGVPLWTYFDSRGIGAPVNFKLAPGGDLVISARSTTGILSGFARVDAQGNELWSLTGVQSLTVGDAASDSAGNTLLVHGGVSSNSGTVVRKLDPQGASIWSRSFGTAGSRIEVGNDDQAVISGFPSTSSAGAAFFKVDQAGNQVWSLPDADGPVGLLLHAHMLLDDSNNAYLAASTLGQMGVCRVDHDGLGTWTTTVPFGTARALALGNTAESVYLVGGNTAKLSPTSHDFCVGDGGDQLGCTDCPCGNEAPAGSRGGCSNSAGTSARLLATGSAKVSNLDLCFQIIDGPPNSFAVLVSGSTRAPANPAAPCFGLDSGVLSSSLDGLRCVVQSLQRHGARMLDASGAVGLTNGGWGWCEPVFINSAFTVGQVRHFQAIYRESPAQGCGSAQNSTQGVTVTFLQ